MNYTENFMISAWSVRGIDKSPAEKVKEWNDLGLTLPIAASNKNNWAQTHELLDEAAKYGMKLIIQDWEANMDNLRINGEEYYRECIQKLVDEFGAHPATYGFYITDEPGKGTNEFAFRAARINLEIAPHLSPYINLLPWFDWIGERMDTDAYAPYLDRVVNEGGVKMLSYDCYAQMYANAVGYDSYFNNLREHYLASKRHNLPFMNIVLCTGHYDYLCPTKDDMLWQFNTSVAHGAKAIGWFIIDIPEGHNYRNAPINLLGERTQEFEWLSEVNRTFNGYYGRIFSALTIDECYHVNKAYGGMPMFEPFGCVVGVEARNEAPLIISSFHNDEGEKFFAVCNNSPRETTVVTLKIKDDCEILRCYFGERFGRPDSLTDPVGEKFNKGGNTKTYTFFMAPGQLCLFKEC